VKSPVSFFEWNNLPETEEGEWKAGGLGFLLNESE
jgi:hypothetical protein